MTINEELTLLKQSLSQYQWEPRDEKQLQEELFRILLEKQGFIREYRLDKKVL